MNKQDLLDLIKLDNSDLVRRWGFEAESPVIEIAKMEATWSAACHFEFVTDPSVPTIGNGCECDCRDCTYHSCNCDNCDEYNEDPDHCEDCNDVNELCTAEPILTAWDANLEPMLELCQEANDDAREWAQLGEGKNWGGHLHIEARDLSRRQSLNAVTIANHLFSLAPQWITGWPDNYNTGELSDKDRTAWLTRRWGAMNRSLPVTAHNLAGLSDPQDYARGDAPDGRKTTIEFRLFRTSFDSDLIRIRGAIARAIVDYAKANEFGLYWVTRCKTFEEVLAELDFGRH